MTPHEPPATGPRIGILEDDPIMAQSLTQRLRLEGYETLHWSCGRDALRDIDRSPFDVLICDIRLPDMSGADVFRHLCSSGRELPVILTTAYGDIDQAVSLMRGGAADYVTKPFDMGLFLEKIANALGVTQRPAGDGELGRSAAMRRIQSLLQRVVDIDSTVLLTGESGVGKEVAARFLHARSRRAARPFVAVNCAAIPAELIESELFGHRKGAFTGAASDHRGYLERAGGGTLFLDEIGDLPPAVQVKLLRVLQERRFTRVGGEGQQAFDARIVAATHADLEAMVRDGRFREDLLFRINVIPVAIPPLRDRPEDIAALLRRFVAEFAGVMGRTGVPRITDAAFSAARTHPWRGNVRELRNRSERAVALADGPTITAADLFPEAGLPEGEPVHTLGAVREQAERRHILSVLDQTGGRIQDAARRLGISRTTLWERMRRLGISPQPD
ncbi:MAG: sigma-54-dependent Fis family transcriptional regulator [Rhodospirillaceae bacterium]|nr:sigma-54-dependent Fis family transcriptional regulator [Rhodospirillaceae bacterium]